jgi:Glycosyl transferase family 2
MTATPAISVLMSVHNNAPFLDAAIRSIRDQTFDDFEFLIVDDGSADGSSAIMDGHALADPRIRIIRQRNAGLIASLNRLVEEARAPLIARMDGDDVALPHRFATQMQWIAQNPGHGAIGSWAFYIDEHGQRGEQTPHTATHHDDLIANLANGPILLHPSVILDRASVRGVGGYRAAYRYCEDYDLWLRLSRVTRMATVPECLLEYRRHAGQVTNVHLLEQRTNAAIAWEAHCETLAGRVDPTKGLKTLPTIDALDRVFGRPGVSAKVRGRIAPEILHSEIALRNGGFDVIVDYVRDGGDQSGLWRTVGRLVALAQPLRALRLAGTLLSL